MFRKIFTCLICIGITFNANAQLNNGLLAHWDFSNNANDNSGNGYNGTAVNVTYVPGKNGIPNTAASFNGKNSKITVPYKAGMNVTKFTICAMVKVNGYYQGTCQANHILSRGADHTAGHYSLHFSDNPFDSVNCKKLDTGKHVFYSGVSNKTPQVNNAAWQYAPTITSGQWYCVVSVFDSLKNDVYVNGTLMSSVQLPTAPIGTSTSGITIGASNNSSQYPYWLNGEIDDLRLYNRALSPTEVDDFCGLFDTVIYITQQPTKLNLCSEDTFSISYNVSHTFKTPNVFRAELSDASGNFANALTIGLIQANGAGTIKCGVPSNLPLGHNYRIRIVSTSPVRASDISQAVSIYPTLYPNVSISASPAGPYNQGQYITFIATPVDAGANPVYQWYRNGNALPNATKDSLNINTLNDGDSIYVVVYSSNPCPEDLSATSKKIGVNILTSVAHIDLHNLLLYPNPNKGNMILSADEVSYKEVNISVLNAVGQVVYRQNVEVNNGKLYHNFQLTGQPAGLYLVRLSADGMERNIRCVIQQ